MFEALEIGIGLEIVQWFQTLRFGLLDGLALLLHSANSGLFYVVVIGAIYWMFDKRLGMRMLFALIIVGLLTLLFKDLLARPRPYQIVDSGIIPLVLEPSFGVPSGHASTSLVTWGYFAFCMKRRSVTIAVVIFVIVMGLSRLYLGVHFPQDIIAGWLLGGVVLGLYIAFVEQVVTWWKAQSIVVQLGLPIAVGMLALLFFMGSIDGLTLVGLLLGLCVAVVIESHYIHFAHVDSFLRRIAQFVLGLIVAIAILEGLDIVFDAIEPPTYVYAADSTEAIMVLTAQVNIEADSATVVCMAAADQDIDEAIAVVCEEQVTPLAAGLRVLRYGLLALFAMSIIPYLCIRANLMKRESGVKS